MKFNLSIRNKLIAGFSLVLVLTATLTVIAEEQLRQLKNTVTETQGKEALLGRAQSALWELRYGFPQFLVLTDAESRKKIIEVEPKLVAIVESNLKDYANSSGLTVEEVQGHKALVEDFDKYKAARPRWFALIADNKPEEAATWRAATTTPFGAATVKGFSNLIELTARQDKDRTETQIKAADRSQILLTVLGVFTTLFGIGAAIYVFRSISSPLGRLQETIASVTTGNLQARAQLKNDDELGMLGANFDRLLDERGAAERKTLDEKVKAEDENERLNNSVISILQAVNLLSQRDLTARAPVTQDIIGTVSDSINALTDETSRVLSGVSLIAAQVAIASGKVKSQGDLVSRTAEDERLNVGKMIDSLTESTQTTNQMATLAEQSNYSAEQATMATDNALETVNGTVKGMESIRETIAETEKRIKRLGERAQEITGIVSLINTISERTHVLALNASMQAAVAGEAGRGFAVVAEEVQRLAESSRNATQQIGTLVSNIQLETNETINTVNRTIDQVVRGSEQAQKAGKEMRRTQEVTAQLVSQVKRIAEGSELQKEMSANLLASVHEMGKSNERTAAQIGTQNVETESLQASARRLVDSVNVFKLPQAA
jgi:methyl-accepting chemotaxis protein